MWESPTALWRRLKLGREEYLQRLVTTLILDGHAPPWNTPGSPGGQGQRFLALLDEAAHGPQNVDEPVAPPQAFIDEYLLPKLDQHAANGWPDWAVLWPNRVWVIELKTEAGSHRPDQLPYYLRLAAAAHPNVGLDLTYITGPLRKPAPALSDGQRYNHLAWDQVVPLIKEAWSRDGRSEVTAYVEMVATIVNNLSRLRPSEQRGIVLGVQAAEPRALTAGDRPVEMPADDLAEPKPGPSTPVGGTALLDLARATAGDGHQRGVGATSPEELEALRDQALAEIGRLSPDDVTRFVLPWLWQSTQTDGKALTPEGGEFGYELRFSRYKNVQVAG